MTEKTKEYRQNLADFCQYTGRKSIGLEKGMGWRSGLAISGKCDHGETVSRDQPFLFKFDPYSAQVSGSALGNIPADQKTRMAFERGKGARCKSRVLVSLRSKGEESDFLGNISNGAGRSGKSISASGSLQHSFQWGSYRRNSGTFQTRSREKRHCGRWNHWKIVKKHGSAN